MAAAHAASKVNASRLYFATLDEENIIEVTHAEEGYGTRFDSRVEVKVLADLLGVVPGSV